MRSKTVVLSLFAWLGSLPGVTFAQTPHPIMFVTQVPVPVDFAAIGSTFANHLASPAAVYRGGDLWIRYPNGSLRNLTQEAGFGAIGPQAPNGIAVRDPHVHWNGTKAVFSMVIGSPGQFQQVPYRWQLYEVTGFGVGQSVSVTLVPNQPQGFNNVMPAYLADGTLVFASDRPRNGAMHLYPQQDEYESAETISGLWRLDPSNGQLKLLDHSPSGDFDPFVDSFGRLLFTRWDHLQRDQQAEVLGNPSGNFDWADESAGATILSTLTEVFPELRDTPPGSPVVGHRLNNFFPWQIAQDGTDAEFLNHLGRHEFHDFINLSFATDPNLVDFTPGNRPNPNPIENMFQMVEDPTVAGRYYAIDAPEFDSHASGQLIRLQAPPNANPDQIVIDYLTPRSTFGTAPAADHSGHYRNPLVLSNGSLVVAHTTQQGGVANLGSATAPEPNYRFRLKTMVAGVGGFMTAGTALTPGISKTVSFFNPDAQVSYTGELWELSPVEVRARPVPAITVEPALASSEVQSFTQAGVSAATFRQFMRRNGLGLLVVRNNTHRDRADRQQPFNLRVPGGVSAFGAGGTIYDIVHFQTIQGDQVRGIGGSSSPNSGRRVLPRFLHEPAAVANNLPNPGGPAGSVPIFSDGSSAVFVPAQRSLSWQQTAANGTPVVRERYWLTVQPGEIRACGGCHGINTLGQANQAPATNTPQALTALITYWSGLNGGLMFADGLE